jgi:hypothetical protein
MPEGRREPYDRLIENTDCIGELIAATNATLDWMMTR